MKKLFLALMAVAAIALVGCNQQKHVNEPEPPENAAMSIYHMTSDSTVQEEGTVFM